jgi:hypothetical protein
LIGCVATVALASLAPAGPTPKDSYKPVLYFPTTVGAKWVYLWQQAGHSEKNREVVEVVTAVEDGKDGAKVVTTGRPLGDRQFLAREKWKVSERGNSLVAGGKLFAPVHWLKLPHTDGQSWETGIGGRVILTAREPERVSVPAGEYETIRVEHRSDRRQEPDQIRWYAPGVGMVKLWCGDLTIVLKSFTPGKE